MDNRIRIVGSAALACLGAVGMARASLGAGTIANSVPAACRTAIVFHNLQAIDRKVIHLETRLNLPVNQDPLQSMETALGLQGDLNETGSAAIVFLAPSPRHHASGAQSVVFMMPCAKIAAAQASLHAGKPLQGIAKGTSPDGSPVYLARRGGYLLMSPARGVLHEFLAYKRKLSVALPAVYRREIVRNDISVYVNMPALRSAAQSSLRSAFRQMIQTQRSLNLKAAASAGVILRLEKRILTQFLADSSCSLIALRISRGGVTLQALSDLQSGTPLAKLLEAQPALPLHPLTGLPNHNYLAAMSYALNGQAVASWLNSLKTIAKNKYAASTAPGNGFNRILATYRRMVAGTRGSRAIFLALARTGGPLLRGVSVYNCRNAPQMMLSVQKQFDLFNPVFHTAGLAFHITPNALAIGGVRFTRIVVALPPTTSADSAAISKIMKIYFGGNSMTAYIGAVGKTNVLEGLGVSKSQLKQAVAAIRHGADSLDRRPSIQALRRHVLPKPNLVAYFSLSRFLSAIVNSLRKTSGLASGTQAANGLVLGVKPPPLVASSSISGDRIRVRLFLPMQTLVQTVNKGRELLPLMLLSR
jgi:hypothetical protein